MKMGHHARHYTSKVHCTLRGYMRFLWQPRKLASSVNLYKFTHFLDFPLGQSLQIACWGKHPQAPLNGICDTSCTIFQSFCKKQNFSFSSLQQKSDDRKITKRGTPTFNGIAAIITLLSATNRSVARSCHLSQGGVVHRKL